jgi:hypothetical protein
MSHIVRRTDQTPVTRDGGNALPTRRHQAAGIFIESQLTLDVEPRLHIAWAVIPRYWSKGYTLMVFRSTTGFSPEKYPEDLNKHGQLIIETNRDAFHDECPEEGTHYFTFVLHKKVLLGLTEKISILRFSETVPSAKVAIGRIKDQIDLQSMLQRHELDQIEHQANIFDANLRLIHSRRKHEETTNPPQPKKAARNDNPITEEIAAVDVMLEAFVAKRQKLEALKRDPKFKNLSRKEQKAVIDTIEQRLDAAELSARREMRGS